MKNKDIDGFINRFTKEFIALTKYDFKKYRGAYDNNNWWCDDVVDAMYNAEPNYFEHIVKTNENELYNKIRLHKNFSNFVDTLAKHMAAYIKENAKWSYEQQLEEQIRERHALEQERKRELQRQEEEKKLKEAQKQIKFNLSMLDETLTSQQKKQLKNVGFDIRSKKKVFK